MTSTNPILTQSDWQRGIRQELTGNILPFWMTRVPDDTNGGFYGALTNDLQIHNDVPRSAVLCARILWTFSTAYRRLNDDSYLAIARRAYYYLSQVFWDTQYGGVYWSVDQHGAPVFDRKHHYAQAFAIYGLSEYYRVTYDPHSLELAQTLFRLLEQYAYDSVEGGYIEANTRTWGTLADMRLSDRDINAPKSMNTALHILEAYTNLMRVWDDDLLRNRHRALINIFHTHILNHDTGHLKLVFNEQWRPVTELISYGHDIEASWLLCEAAEMHNDASLLARTRQTAVDIAESVYRSGRDTDGSLFYEGSSQGILAANKDWWVQAEALVGFYNAYQFSGQPKFAQAALDCWNFIETHHIDRVHGDWFKSIYPNGTVDATHYKVGPWDCPYHHSRACFEMLERLSTLNTLSGTFTGIARNSNGFDLQISISFTAPCQVGSICATFTIPEIPCTGDFRLVSIENDTLQLKTENTHGPCGPADSDTLQLLSNGTLLYLSRGPGWEARGVLQRH
jgi:mannobiose 2-epimerase